MVGLNSALSIELELEILEQLQAVSPRSLLNVSLSSKPLYRCARGLIYRAIHLTFTQKRREINRRLIENLLGSSELGLKVQELTIHRAPDKKLPSRASSKADFDRLRELLPRLTGLRTFIWDAQYSIQRWLLDVLCLYSPNCQLYIQAPIGNSVKRNIRPLHGVPILYSLHVYPAVFIPPESYIGLRDLITQCNHEYKLKDLAIDQEIYPAGIWLLENLSPQLQLRSLEVDGPTYMGDSVWQWSVEWSMLERLSISYIHFPSDLAPQMNALKILRLRFNGQDNKQALLGILRDKCPNLTSLDLTACTTVINELRGKLWDNFGHNLESLRIHEDERFDERPILSPLNLESIARNCCRLRSLGLDLNHSEHPV